MATRLADRLSAVRRRQFVGRGVELALFQQALATPELPFLVLHVYGPGGVGKSSLLRAYVELAAQANVPLFPLDARNLDPSPDGFLTALRTVMALGEADSPAQALAAGSRRTVVVVDTCELLAPLDNWLREVFLPQLPENVLVVLAGREPPSSAWRVDPGWQALLRTVPLRNLSPDESRAYLSQRGLPAEQTADVLDFTHGHPLALSLVADLFTQRQAPTAAPAASTPLRFHPEAAPDVIKVLLEQLVQKVPGPAHRVALEACALVRLTTQPLLAELIGIPDARELFDWLRNLSFMDSGPLGIFPHDLTREALAADLRWRNPTWYADLHRRARTCYLTHLQHSQPEEHRRVLFDLVFLHRENAAVRPFFEWQQSGMVLPDAAWRAIVRPCWR